MDSLNYTIRTFTRQISVDTIFSINSQILYNKKEFSSGEQNFQLGGCFSNIG